MIDPQVELCREVVVYLWHIQSSKVSQTALGKGLLQIPIAALVCINCHQSQPFQADEIKR